MRRFEMKPKRKWIAPVTVIAMVIALAVGVGINAAFGTARAGSSESELPEVCEAKPRHKVEIATAKLIIENNATDEDLGVHGAFDDEGWVRALRVRSRWAADRGVRPPQSAR